MGRGFGLTSPERHNCYTCYHGKEQPASDRKFETPQGRKGFECLARRGWNCHPDSSQALYWRPKALKEELCTIQQ